jgi:hypothetical protein
VESIRRAFLHPGKIDLRIGVPETLGRPDAGARIEARLRAEAAAQARRLAPVHPFDPLTQDRGKPPGLPHEAHLPVQHHAGGAGGGAGGSRVCPDSTLRPDRQRRRVLRGREKTLE